VNYVDKQTVIDAISQTLENYDVIAVNREAGMHEAHIDGWVYYEHDGTAKITLELRKKITEVSE
jgi:late competence protein required for DNA uptake (superfamily II DNA/RNA helicase)